MKVGISFYIKTSATFCCSHSRSGGENDWHHTFDLSVFDRVGKICKSPLHNTYQDLSLQWTNQCKCQETDGEELPWRMKASYCVCFPIHRSIFNTGSFGKKTWKTSMAAWSHSQTGTSAVALGSCWSCQDQWHCTMQTWIRACLSLTPVSALLPFKCSNKWIA